MKKIFVFILSITVLLSIFVFSVSASETKTYNITDIEGKYKTQGRTELSSGTLYMEWSASGIEFNANCSGDVSISVNTTRLWSGNTGGIYFTVVVDGVVQHENLRIPENNNANSWTSNSTNYPFRIKKRSFSNFVIAENLEPGVHSFAIYNQTESKNGAFGIRSITMNGEFVEPPKKNDLYIEFVGDSITAGLGNLSVGGQEAPLYQDATRGWPYLTAKKLNADWSIIAESGITASNGIGWSGANSVSMQTVYPKLRYHSNNTTEYDFGRTADIVVLGLGTNDFWTYQDGGKTLKYLSDQFKEMVAIIQKYNPNAKIIWIHGMMINDADALIADVVKELGGENNGLYTLLLPKNLEGGQGHPNLAVQQTYADMLSDYIVDILNDKNQEDTASKPNNSQSKPNNKVEASVNTEIYNRPSKGSSYANKNNANTDSTVTESSDGDDTENILADEEILYEELKTETISGDNEEKATPNKTVYVVSIVLGSLFLLALISFFIGLFLNRKKKF